MLIVGGQHLDISLVFEGVRETCFVLHKRFVVNSFYMFIRLCKFLISQRVHSSYANKYNCAFDIRLFCIETLFFEQRMELQRFPMVNLVYK